MQSVWSATTFPCAVVHQECRAIHLYLAGLYQVIFSKTANIFSGLILQSPFQLLLLLSLANLAHVDQTASVEKSMTRQSVHVFLVSSGRHLLADLSVLPAQSVGRTKPASIKNAEILAQELVVLEQNAMSSTTIQFAVVHHDTLVIHFQDAILNVSLL